jgi:hypothetical protein
MLRGPIARIYGPEKGAMDGTWKLPLPQPYK